MHPAPLAPRFSAHQTFIHFHGILAADGVPIRPHHSGAQFVKYGPGGFVSREAELSLELQGGLAGRLRGDEVCRPEPDRERRVRGLHHGARSQRRILFARPAPEHGATARAEAERLAVICADGTVEPVWPAD